MLSIVHIDTGSDLRGGQIQLLMLARDLRERGHRQLVATLEGTALESRARDEGLRVFLLPAHDPLHAFGALLLRQVLQSEKIQVIHAHDGLGQTISWFSSVGLPVKRVASRRVTFAPRRPIDTRVKYGWMCDAVIAVSDYVKGLLVSAGVPASRIEVIPDGVELAEALPRSARPARARPGSPSPSDSFTLGYLGALTPEKGFDIATRALARVQRTLPDAGMIVASAVLEPLPAPCRNVRFVMLADDTEEFFARIDVFIMPSLAEGLGSAALLAMAHGVPVIASRVGGVPEIVSDGETGWLVPPGDAEALTSAITAAASDRARLRAIGEKGRDRAAQFSSKLMVDRTEALYNRLCHLGSEPLRH